MRCIQDTERKLTCKFFWVTLPTPRHIVLVGTLLSLTLHPASSSLGQMGVRGDPVHLVGGLASLLAQETAADAQGDHGGPLPVQLPGVGRQVGHRQRPGETSCVSDGSCPDAAFSSQVEGL